MQNSVVLILPKTIRLNWEDPAPLSLAYRGPQYNMDYADHNSLSLINVKKK